MAHIIYITIIVSVQLATVDGGQRSAISNQQRSFIIHSAVGQQYSASKKLLSHRRRRRRRRRRPLWLGMASVDYVGVALWLQGSVIVGAWILELFQRDEEEEEGKMAHVRWNLLAV